MSGPIPTTISYSINGVPLLSLASRIETAEGTQTAPALVGDDVPVWGRDGALDVHQLGQQRRPDGIGRITFALALKGVDPDTGLISAGGSLQDYLDGVDRAIRLFYTRTLTIDAQRPDGSVRRAIGHLLPGESLDFTRERSSPAFGRYVAAIAIPAAHWTDLDAVTTGPIARTTGGTVSLTAFAEATARGSGTRTTRRSSRARRSASLPGPGNNPRLTTSGGHLAWNGVIAAGRELLLSTGTGLTGPGAGAVWTPGYLGLDYSPGPGYFEIDPSEPLSAVLTHTGGGSMTVQITGRRRYRTS